MRRRQSEAGEVSALILDAAQRQALVAIRELGRAGVRAAAVECEEGAPAPAFASRWCAASALVPGFTRSPETFVDALLDLCAQWRPRVLIPLHDGSIEALRARRSELERTVALALAPERALAAAVDKPRTLQTARVLGVRVPRGVVVSEPDAIGDALAEVGLPVVVKPARSWAQARAGGARLNAVAATSEAAARTAVVGVLDEEMGAVLQEWLPGEREAVSVIYAQGRVWARFAQRTTRAVPPLGGSSVRRESIPLPPDLARDAERLVGELELEGYAEVEFRRDARGKAALMEVNPRLSASVELAVRAGVPFPRLLYEWAAGERLREQRGYRSGVRMRWLGGDLSWLKKVLAAQGQPDSPPARRAVGAFFADFGRPLHYDYLDPRDLRPALVASAGAVRKLRGGGSLAADPAGAVVPVGAAGAPGEGVHGGASGGPVGAAGDRAYADLDDGARSAEALAAHAHTPQAPDTDVAVIGAGPYGLSIAAHLAARGVAHEIFGEPMGTWSEHMPRGMCLKSEGFASSLSDPRGECTLARFCTEAGLEYGDVGVPVRLDTFERYGRAFQERYVHRLRRERVAQVRQAAGGFALGLDTGETLRARRVILATGVQGHAHLPPVLHGLPPERVVHSFDQRDPARWRGLRVAVVGAGQSALEAAVLLQEQGAEVTVLAREGTLVWNGDPAPGMRSPWARIRYPSSGLGDGLRLRLYASHPLIVHATPRLTRLRVAYTALGPAGAWWLRPRFEGRVRTLAGRTVQAVEPAGDELQLTLRPSGRSALEADRRSSTQAGAGDGGSGARAANGGSR
ncbi:MAG TPA: NAD(P)-binding domain-containing protein, partial [Solirubrobacteraceae bacterium]|nr:NAD(P)-binding domain-containing protein [Solirubrobacteraceae bacterium]